MIVAPLILTKRINSDEALNADLLEELTTVCKKVNVFLLEMALREFFF